MKNLKAVIQDVLDPLQGAALIENHVQDPYLKVVQEENHCPVVLQGLLARMCLGDLGLVQALNLRDAHERGHHQTQAQDHTRKKELREDMIDRKDPQLPVHSPVCNFHLPHKQLLKRL